MEFVLPKESMFDHDQLGQHVTLCLRKTCDNGYFSLFFFFSEESRYR